MIDTSFGQECLRLAVAAALGGAIGLALLVLGAPVKVVSVERAGHGRSALTVTSSLLPGYSLLDLATRLRALDGRRRRRARRLGSAAVSHEHTHVVHNGKRELTIDELARMQPGMDRLMAEVGPRLHRCYHAALAGNWPLAAYFGKSAAKQLALCAESRPKYEPEMTAFLREDFAPVTAAIKTQDLAAFESAWPRMVDRANELHVFFGKPFIGWKTPEQPPDDLDLRAGMA